MLRRACVFALEFCPSYRVGSSSHAVRNAAWFVTLSLSLPFCRLFRVDLYGHVMPLHNDAPLHFIAWQQKYHVLNLYNYVVFRRYKIARPTWQFVLETRSATHSFRFLQGRWCDVAIKVQPGIPSSRCRYKHIRQSPHAISEKEHFQQQ